MIGGIVCRDNNGTKYWYHYDRLGNVVAVTNTYSGSVEALYTMDAFGNVLEITNRADFGSERSTDVQPYHLTTKEYDPDSRLCYFNARWYDPTAGRFISREPLLGGVQGNMPLWLGRPVQQESATYLEVAALEPWRWNAYAFCANNPLVYVEPDGRFVWELVGSVVGAAVGCLMFIRFAGLFGCIAGAAGGALVGLVAGALVEYEEWAPWVEERLRPLRKRRERERNIPYEFCPRGPIELYRPLGPLERYDWGGWPV